MKAGKLSESVLKRSVLKQLHTDHVAGNATLDETMAKHIVTEPQIGADYAAAQLNRKCAGGIDVQAGKSPAGADIHMPDSIAEGTSVVSAMATRCLGGSMNPMLSVYAALNNLYCSGAEAYGIMVNLLLPTSANENELRKWVKMIDIVCAK